MIKIKRILIMTLALVALVVGSQAAFAYEDDVNYPKSIIIPVVTE